MKRAVRLIRRLGLMTGLFLAGRAAFKRWVEGPEVQSSNPGWPDSGRTATTQAASSSTTAANPPAQASPSPTETASPSTASDESWVKPSDEGEAPSTHPVKAKVSSRVYRVPGMTSYDLTRPDRCYSTPEAAEADGFTRAKR